MSENMPIYLIAATILLAAFAGVFGDTKNLNKIAHDEHVYAGKTAVKLQKGVHNPNWNRKTNSWDR